LSKDLSAFPKRLTRKTAVNDSIKTTCPYCGVGCGIEASVDQQQHRLVIRGDQSHPANFGRLCSKGSALGETVELKGRLLQPKIFGQPTSWTTALDKVAHTFRQIINQHGPDAVAIYASGQLLTEDYYVANKLMKGFIGSANIDTNSRLCMSSSVAGHKRAFGADIVPGCYQDLEMADMIVLIGSNAAWCHPVSFQRIRTAKTSNPSLKIVVIDPRKTPSCDIADLHLPLASGSDAWLFNGLLHFLHQQHLLDKDYIQAHTEGFAAALLSAGSANLKNVAQHCRLQEADLQLFYDWFGAHNKVMSLYSQGINQSSSGTDKVNSIINCHLATGRIGKPGMGPFSLTGQPNAMGGREVGGLAHQLAAHMDFSNPADVDRVARFWNSPNIASKPGLPAVELFDAIDAGQVKAVWIMATNPVVSLPNADKVKQALGKCSFVVVSDCMEHTDTTAFAHVLLPAQGWSEKDGTVTNSERRISRQRSLFAASANAKPDWWIVSQVAQRLGFVEAFAYQSPVDIFREHAALSGFENDVKHGLRDFDISAYQNISLQDYQTLQPTQWPVNQQYPQGRTRFFDDGKYFTATGKAQLIAITPKRPVNQPDSDYPLILNTGRLRDQWHTMTRTALAAKLNQHKPEAYVDIHPQDAAVYGLAAKTLALLESRWGKMLARVQINDNVQPGNLFVPMHWTAQYASLGRMGALVNPVVDPISKQPESKHTPVRIKPYAAGWYGFVLSRRELAFKEIDYWLVSKGDGYYRYELAGESSTVNLQNWLHAKLADHEQPADWLEYQDKALGSYRAASIINGCLDSVMFIANTPNLPERHWLASLFGKGQLDTQTRKTLLTGIAPKGTPDVGNIICACFNVGEKTIRAEILKKNLKTVKEVSDCLKAGTNCGSCLAEIKGFL
jgi:assimilatory nitrate reductase catalytic subunit